MDWRIGHRDQTDVAAGRWGVIDPVRVFLSTSPAAREFLDEQGGDVGLGVLTHRGEIRGGGIDFRNVGDDASLLARAQALGMQVRVEMVADGYVLRHVDYAAIHGVEGDDMDAFAEALELRECASVLDSMCGYGDVGRHVLDVAESAGRTVSVTFCDLHRAQLDTMDPKLRGRAAEVVVGDARGLPFEDGRFDAVAVKMGVHEVRQADQPYVFQEAYRVLRPGGIFAVWDVMPEDGEMQDAFHAVFDMKNELAGYESFVRDRYYPRHDQMPWLFREAGFTAVEDVRTCHFRQSTLKRRDSELGGSDEKLAQLNEYARHRITPELGRRMDMEDRGNDILLTVPNRIIRGRKPRT